MILDKYFGDALYAALIYLMLRAACPQQANSLHLIAAAFTVIAIELFQLTGIGLEWREQGNRFQKLISIALGTRFGFIDLFAYAVGLAGIYWFDRIFFLKLRPTNPT
ncbi:MAG: DUF2809 domain-containing protein [Mariniblastus sp.]|nr:DUF2809 domain-containing protein [Mariniblastus sp.]